VDKFQIGLLAMSMGVFLIALRIQIGVALGIVSFFGIAAILGWRPAWGIVTAIPFNFVGDWNLTAIPMFLLMGYIAFATKLTAGLFQAMRVVPSPAWPPVPSFRPRRVRPSPYQPQWRA
jgi:TRAP-type mannitol/chloroaromatic compound transport system permease large subunit